MMHVVMEHLLHPLQITPIQNLRKVIVRKIYFRTEEETQEDPVKTMLKNLENQEGDHICEPHVITTCTFYVKSTEEM